MEESVLDIEKVETENSIEAIFVEPLLLSTDNLVEICEYDVDEFQNGIKEASKECGLFTAYLNVGMTNVQAYELILTKMTLDYQAEISKDSNKTAIEVSKNQAIMIEKNQL